MSIKRLIQVAQGEKPADLLLTNCRIVNLFSGRITAGNIAVADGTIVGFDAKAAGTVRDMKGCFVAPGLIDAHLHIESTLCTPGAFARAVLPLGTTTAVADPHEIANVLGAAGIQYMLDSARDQPMNLFFTLPSCVPATHMETAGAELGPEALAPFFKQKQIVALAEMMNFPGVIANDPEVLAKIQLAGRAGKPVDGHAPGLSKAALWAYLCAGIGSDHECTTLQEAEEKLAAGMRILVREGTCARNLDALLPLITPQTARQMSWCTDDRHPHDLLDQGHMDYILRRAIAGGLDPVLAIQMGTLNPARYFNLRHLGAIAPGYQADLMVFSDLSAPRAEAVYCRGILVAENGRLQEDIPWPAPIPPPPSMHLDPTSLDFSIPAQGETVRVIRVLADQVVTGHESAEARVENKQAVADPARDLLKIAVIERHHGSGAMGRGFVSGLGLRSGAIASSVAHDSHNLIVAGASDAAMKAAVRAVVEMKGGFAVADGDRITARLALPIAGLMSEAPMNQVRRELDALLEAAHALGSPLSDPFMALGFLALPVIPSLKITDKGLVDVQRFSIVPLFL